MLSETLEVGARVATGGNLHRLDQKVAKNPEMYQDVNEYDLLAKLLTLYRHKPM